jgi:lysophospholipase L1-like esterase
MSNRKQPASYTQHPITVAAMGDSLTRNYTCAMADADFWPARLAAALTAAGLPAIAKNCGVSGNKTATMVSRRAALTTRPAGQTEVPAIAVVFGGVNDPATPISTVNIVGNINDAFVRVAVGEDSKFTVGAGLRVNGVHYTITAVNPFVISISPNLSTALTVGMVIYHSTQLNVAAIGQAAINAGCDRVAIVSAQYLNFASNTGDTLATDYATYAPVRVEQAAAAVNLAAANPTKDVIFVDLHAYLKALITGGTVTQGNDVAWHVAVGDQHFNTTGQQYVANAIYAAIAAAGWVGELA